MGKSISVYAIFSSRSSVERALGALQRGGFRHDDVSVLLPEDLVNKDLVTEENSESPGGAVVGGATGGIVGGGLGWLIGAGAFAIPGLGPLIAAGPLLAAIAGAAAALGGVTGALIGFGMPEFEAERYEGRVKSGGSLLLVHCDDKVWAGRAEEIVREAGGEDVTRAGDAAADHDKTDKSHLQTAGSL